MHSALLADIGVPMIFVQWPLMFCALVPVIFIEAEVARRQLALPYRRALAGAAKANVFSTFIGVPAAWMIMVGVQVVASIPLSLAAQRFHWRPDSPLLYVFSVLAVAWPGPPVSSWWPIAFAATLLLVPTFFVSVWLERSFYRRSWSDLNPALVNRSAWWANFASYAVLFSMACIWTGWMLYMGPAKAPAVKRLLQVHPIDVAYLHDVIIPSCDAPSRAKFVDAVAKLEACLADFEGFMRDVEEGKIAVWKNLSRGRWESSVRTPDNWITATYADKIAPVANFEKRESEGRLICRFDFNSAGYITYVNMVIGDFSFNENGRLKHWHGDKADCWDNPSK